MGHGVSGLNRKVQTTYSSYWGDTNVFPDQQRDVIFPVCPGASSWLDLPKRVPMTLEPPQLTPQHVEEQQLLNDQTYSLKSTVVAELKRKYPH